MLLLAGIAGLIIGAIAAAVAALVWLLRGMTS